MCDIAQTRQQRHDYVFQMAALLEGGSLGSLNSIRLSCLGGLGGNCVARKPQVWQAIFAWFPCRLLLDMPTDPADGAPDNAEGPILGSNEWSVSDSESEKAEGADGGLKRKCCDGAQAKAAADPWAASDDDDAISVDSATERASTRKAASALATFTSPPQKLVIAPEELYGCEWWQRTLWQLMCGTREVLPAEANGPWKYDEWAGGMGNGKWALKASISVYTSLYTPHCILL